MTHASSQPGRLTSDDVRRIAALAHLALTDTEVERMRDELSHILAQFQVLQTIDTSGIEPTGHSVGVDSVMRADEPRPPLPVEDVLANAPRREGDLFRVRAVIE